MAVDVKQAVAKAAEYAKELYPPALGILLEEVESATDDHRPVWRVTLSFFLPDDPSVTNPMKRLLEQAQLGGAGAHLSKHFRVFVIDQNHGNVQAMRMREGLAQR